MVVSLPWYSLRSGLAASGSVGRLVPNTLLPRISTTRYISNSSLHSSLHYTSNTQANNNLISGAFHRLNTVHKMGSSPEILAAQAAVAYRNHKFDESARLCALVHRSDSLCTAAVCTRISCLVDLKRVSELFYFAHQLVDSRPRSAVSWFAVGAYYHLIGKNDVAQRHFGKVRVCEERLPRISITRGRFAPVVLATLGPRRKRLDRSLRSQYAHF